MIFESVCAAGGSLTWWGFYLAVFYYVKKHVWLYWSRAIKVLGEFHFRPVIELGICQKQKIVVLFPLHKHLFTIWIPHPHYLLFCFKILIGTLAIFFLIKEFRFVNLDFCSGVIVWYIIGKSESTPFCLTFGICRGYKYRIHSL